MTKSNLMDIARYRVGQRVYWIVLRFDSDPEFERAEPWMRSEHPWVLWRHKIVPWIVPMTPPRVHPCDSMAIQMLIGQRPRIEPFVITEIERSPHTGTFLYTGPKKTVMPEGMLFPSVEAAKKEVARIARVFKAWMKSWDLLQGQETNKN